jgi:hypothetical protein
LIKAKKSSSLDKWKFLKKIFLKDDKILIKISAFSLESHFFQAFELGPCDFETSECEKA